MKMSATALFFFVLLLLGLILCSFLGTRRQGFTANSYTTENGGQAKTVTTNKGNTYGVATGSQGNMVAGSSTNYDNYNHYTGSSIPTLFYGPNGGTARVIQTPTNNTIVITSQNGTTDIYYIDNPTDSSTSTNGTSSTNANMNANMNTTMNTYYGPNGASATIVTDNSGKQMVEISTSSGNKIVYTQDNMYQSPTNDMNSDNDISNTNTSYPSSTSSTYPSSTSSTYPSSTSSTYPSSSSSTYPSSSSSTYPSSSSSTYQGTNYDSSAYYNSLPQGVPRSQIPQGQEDLYILKTEVVPPVCPVCPPPIVQCPDKFDASKCPPCPPCARCPEPSFECKKVPNYSAFNPDTMPVPVLTNFSSFGM